MSLFQQYIILKETQEMQAWNKLEKTDCRSLEKGRRVLWYEEKTVGNGGWRLNSLTNCPHFLLNLNQLATFCTEKSKIFDFYDANRSRQLLLFPSTALSEFKSEDQTLMCYLFAVFM